MLNTIYTILIGGALTGIVFWLSSDLSKYILRSKTILGKILEILFIIVGVWFIGIAIFFIVAFWMLVIGDLGKSLA